MSTSAEPPRRPRPVPSTSAGGGGSTAASAWPRSSSSRVVVWAVTQGSGSPGTALPSFTIAYGQGTVANSDSIIDSDAALAKTIPAHLQFVPFDAGVTAIAEMRSGSLQAISGVGNPPVVGAIGTNTGVDVVIAQSFDADALIVPKSITKPSPAGRQVRRRPGRVVRGLRAAGLARRCSTSRPRSRSSASPASRRRPPPTWAARSTAAYVQAGPEAQLIAKGGHPMIDAEQIAKLGIPGLNVVAVSQKLVKSDPALVQKYVCAEVQATRLFTGPQADKYLTQSAKVQGVPGNLIVSATKAFPFIPLSQQLHWLGVHAQRHQQPDRQGLRADRQVPGRAGPADRRPRPRRCWPPTSTRRSSRRRSPVAADAVRGASPAAPGVGGGGRRRAAARRHRTGAAGRAIGAHVVLESVGKTFRRAGRRTVAISGVDLQVARGRAGLPARPVGLREVHLAAHRRRGAGRRPGLGDRRRAGR